MKSQLPSCSGYSMTHERWSYFRKNCARNFLRFRFGSFHVFRCRHRRKETHSKIDIAGWLAGIFALKYANQTGTSDLLTKYFIKIWTFPIWLLLYVRVQCQAANGARTGLLPLPKHTDARNNPNCNGYTSLTESNALARMNKWNQLHRRKKKHNFWRKGIRETLRAWPMSHSHDNSTGFVSCYADGIRWWWNAMTKLCAMDCLLLQTNTSSSSSSRIELTKTKHERKGTHWE